MPDPPFALRNRAVYVTAADALVVADLHLGRGRSSNVEFPLGETDSIRERLDELVETFGPTEVVIAGDALHSFSRIPDGVADSLAALRGDVEDRGTEFVLLEGNHDAMLGSVVDVDPISEYRLGDGTIVCHGHAEPEADAGRYVIGHEHPAIDVEGHRRPCFLWGKAAWEDSDVLALPAFNELAAGVEVNGLSGRDVSSPLLSDLGSFRPIVYDDAKEEALTFPRIADMREYL